MFVGGGTNSFDAFFKRGVGGGDFAGTNFGFYLSLDFKLNIININVVVFEGSGNDIEVTIAELLNEEGVFDTNFDFTISGGY